MENSHILNIFAPVYWMYTNHSCNNCSTKFFLGFWVSNITLNLSQIFFALLRMRVFFSSGAEGFHLAPGQYRPVICYHESPPASSDLFPGLPICLFHVAVYLIYYECSIGEENQLKLSTGWSIWFTYGHTKRRTEVEL